jgi:lysophospholipase L1-like esterase
METAASRFRFSGAASVRGILAMLSPRITAALTGILPAVLLFVAIGTPAQTPPVNSAQPLPAPVQTSVAKELTLNPALPTVFIVGDSTARNQANLGWGDHLARYFDTSRINVANRAIAGRSSRTFINEGHWDKVLAEFKPGDYVLLQLGHNDGGALDGPKPRGTLRGLGEESKDVPQMDGHVETVHTFGWYQRKYIAETRARHATPILLTLTVRNIWTAGADGRQRIERDMGYDAAIRQLASDQQVLLVDMANYEADHLEAAGPEKTALLFPLDHTHSSAEGAELNAQIFVRALRATQSPLIGYLAQGISWPEIATPSLTAAPATNKSAEGAVK